MKTLSLDLFIVPALVAVSWYFVAPVFVALGNPRIRQRNPDHYSRLVRFSRLWGLVAVLVGFAVAFVG